VTRCRARYAFPCPRPQSVEVRCQLPKGHIDRHTFTMEWGTRKNLEAP